MSQHSVPLVKVQNRVLISLGMFTLTLVWVNHV